MSPARFRFGFVQRTASIAMTVAILGACSTTGSASSGERDTDAVTTAKENVASYFANNSAAFELPNSADSNILRNKKIMYLSAGLSSPGGTASLAAFKEVEEDLGFESIVYDGQFNLTNYQEGMRQAVSRNADALILYGVDCTSNEAALGEVRAAGIKIIGVQSVDCDEVDPSAEAFFDAQPLYPIGNKQSGTVSDVSEANGVAQADYLIDSLDGRVRAIQFDLADFAVTAAVGRGFRDRMAECSSCEVVETVQVSVGDFGPTLQQKAEQALLKHPEANAIAVDYDDLITVGISAAVNSSGRKAGLTVVAGGGQAAAMDLIRNDAGLDAGWVQPYEWDHYAALDTAMRLLAGQEPAINAMPVVLYDNENNMPEDGRFMTNTDFRGTFRQAWGVG